MKSSAPSLANVPWVAALSQLVQERLGYEIPEHRLTLEIAPRVVAYAEAHGTGHPERFVDALRAEPSGEAWRALVQAVTVGETYFLRHPEQLAALAARLETRAQDLTRPLQIWSAGCATGEEPYSLAMLLDERGVSSRVLGTDVDASALEKARAASGFSDRSVSHLPRRLRERWLETTRPGTWRLVDREHLGVRFQPHNLVHDAPLRPESGGGWDAILCRNVLLYFPSETGTAVVGRLGQALGAGGGLWVGPCDHVELAPAAGLGWHTEDSQRYLAQGAHPPRPARRASPRRSAAPTPTEVETTPARLVERGLLATARRTVEEQLEAKPEEGELLLLLGAFHLREHAFDEALAAFEKAETVHPKPSGLAYLQGVAHLKAGRSDAAASAFATALEDDPDNWASSCQLALLYRRAGRTLREEVMLLRTLDRLGADTPRPTELGVGARLVQSVHSDPELTRREVARRMTELVGREQSDRRPS